MVKRVTQIFSVCVQRVANPWQGLYIAPHKSSVVKVSMWLSRE